MAIIGIPTAPVSPFYHRGEYDNSTAYAVNDVVSYNGGSYINVFPLGSTGTAPTVGQNSAYWRYLAVKGEVGATGPQGLRGLTGDPGPTGQAGADGAPGVKGDPGNAGAVGATGPAGPQGAAGPAGATGATGPAGADGTVLLSRGDYSAGTTYAKNDVVSFNGSSFVNISPTGSTGTSPTAQVSNATWQLLARGLQTTSAWSVGTTYNTGQVVTYANNVYVSRTDGQSGRTPTTQPTYWTQLIRGLTVQGEWSPGTSYKLNDIVLYNGASYIAIADNLSQNPTNVSYWNVLSAKGDTGPAGTNGTDGAAGPAGPTGATGPQGPIGATGQTGSIGPTGSAGSNGATGATGATGPTGATGAQGPKGDKGDKGDPGASGSGGGVRGSYPLASIRPLAFLFTIGIGATSATTMSTTGDLACSPIYVAADCTIDRFVLTVTAVAGTPSLWRLGLYADAGVTAHPYPGALIIDAGTVTGETLGVKSITVATPISLTAGIYWIAGKPEGSNYSGVRGTSSAVWGVIPSSSAAADETPSGYRYAATGNGLPASWPAYGVGGLTGTIAIAPRVGMRVATVAS